MKGLKWVFNQICLIVLSILVWIFAPALLIVARIWEKVNKDKNPLAATKEMLNARRLQNIADVDRCLGELKDNETADKAPKS